MQSNLVLKWNDNKLYPHRKIWAIPVESHTTPSMEGMTRRLPCSEIGTPYTGDNCLGWGVTQVWYCTDV